ncbi:GMC family oxidoreductase [Chryseobacterium pennipullorum]|uniref:GMC family oxidoreductase n=1 Tax=Chryseobacterium pennipullorum TaxID=2258963 RepID=A0A3D9B1G2_9FLAO|nr:GMC oxidoreductase [Chryseobacterium pennipullorum]REC47505.1 GMC family oxidoreductase [Chryseobacterium pennipullorum]
MEENNKSEHRTYDFIIVGSGAGGGPLAANLVEEGFSVLILEAGTDHSCDYYNIPIMQGRASEDAEMRWDFFVRHYASDTVQAKDSKFMKSNDGVLYPRGATLGGSTATNAMVNVYPHNSDWDHLARLTGNEDWNAEAMRHRYIRIENWQGPDVDRQKPAAPHDGSRHGFEGWLKVSRANPELAGREPRFLDIINAMEEISREKYQTPADTALPNDPNDWRFVSSGGEGMSFVPVAVGDGTRNGARERILSALQKYPDRLTIRYGSLVKKVIFEGNRAYGVEYLSGKHLYSADPKASEALPEPKIFQAFASKEVIIAAGAFNTPQILKLSGIGPREELESHGINVVVDSPGVGENLQDRYEVGLVYQLKEEYSLFKEATLDVPEKGQPGDPLFREWSNTKGGPYSTNGSLAAFITKSSIAEEDPDLFILALPISFKGYYPGYSGESAELHDRLTFVILKAHTKNKSGFVQLRSADPRERPAINFRYFEEGNDTEGKDMQGVVEGIEIAREIADRLGTMIKTELIPGKDADSRAALSEFVHNEAWGHHASCTCKIGADHDPMAVLDGDFRVRGTEGLRVVDASVFAKIPGFFIVSAVYMISERASDVLIRKYRSPQ